MLRWMHRVLGGLDNCTSSVTVPWWGKSVTAMASWRRLLADAALLSRRTSASAVMPRAGRMLADSCEAVALARYLV